MISAFLLRTCLRVGACRVAGVATSGKVQGLCGQHEHSEIGQRKLERHSSQCIVNTQRALPACRQKDAISVFGRANLAMASPHCNGKAFFGRSAAPIADHTVCSISCASSTVLVKVNQQLELVILIRSMNMRKRGVHPSSNTLLAVVTKHARVAVPSTSGNKQHGATRRFASLVWRTGSMAKGEVAGGCFHAKAAALQLPFRDRTLVAITMLLRGIYLIYTLLNSTITLP